MVNDVIYNFGVTSTDISTLWAHADHRLLVTARARPLRSVDRLREAVRRGEAFRSPLDLVVHLLRDQADVLVQIVRETGVSVDQIEDQLLSQRLQATALTWVRCGAGWCGCNGCWRPSPAPVPAAEPAAGVAAGNGLAGVA